MGLVGVYADVTSISTVGKADAGLTYRGYAIEDLASRGTFEETAHLLLHGSLPTERQLRAYKAALALHRALPAEVRVAKRWLRARVQGGHQSARVRENRA